MNAKELARQIGEIIEDEDSGGRFEGWQMDAAVRILALISAALVAPVTELVLSALDRAEGYKITKAEGLANTQFAHDVAVATARGIVALIDTEAA